VRSNVLDDGSFDPEKRERLAKDIAAGKARA